MQAKALVERVQQIPVRRAPDVPTICDGNVPLQGADSKLFVDLTNARGGNRIAEVERRIRWAPVGTYEKHLITGHAGSGKSTELHRLAHDLQQNKDEKSFHVVEFDIQQRLDPSDIQLPELVTTLFSALWSDPILKVPSLPTAKLLAREFLAWMKPLVPGLAGDVAKGIPALATLLKNADLQRRFRENTWQYTARVIEQMGDLIQEIRNKLVKAQEIDDIVIIIDNLEKMLCREINGQTNYELLFIEQLPKLESLPVHMVLTFPVSLHADQAQLRAAYANAVAIQIPMVRLRHRENDQDDAVGFEAMRSFLARRLELGAIFSNPEVCNDAIRASGGCVRDLLRIVASAVVERGSVPIDAEDIKRTVARLAGDLERVLQGRPFLQHLHTVHRTGSLPVEIDADGRKWLLQNLIVIEYNREVWYDVHPLARLTRAYQDAKPKDRPAPSAA
jgi:hypothetical protein